MAPLVGALTPSRIEPRLVWTERPQIPPPTARLPVLLLPLCTKSLNDLTVKSPYPSTRPPSLHHSTPSPLPTPLTHIMWGWGRRRRGPETPVLKPCSGGPAIHSFVHPCSEAEERGTADRRTPWIVGRDLGGPSSDHRAGVLVRVSRRRANLANHATGRLFPRRSSRSTPIRQPPREGSARGAP